MKHSFAGRLIFNIGPLCLLEKCQTFGPESYPTKLSGSAHGSASILSYGKCSKISNTSCLLKKSRQTVQTQIRLLLKKQSDQDLP